MANPSVHLPQNVYDEIVRVLQDRPSTLKNVSWFLYQETKKVSVYIQVLKSAASNFEAFRDLVEILGKDLDELEQNPNHKTVMNEMWLNHTLNFDATNFVRGQRLDFKLILEKKKRCELLAICLGISIMLRLNVLTPEMLRKLIPMLNQVLNITMSSPLSLFSIEELLNMATKLSGERYEVTASIGYFLYDIWQNKKRFENGEISGYRCVKNIIDSLTEMGPGVAGGFGGEVFGGSIAPGIGTFVGGVGGGVMSTYLTGTLSDRITQRIFNLPKDEALENAFRDLNLPCNVSNNEINISFIRLAHQYLTNPNHPDRKWEKIKESINCINNFKT